MRTIIAFILIVLSAVSVYFIVPEPSTPGLVYSVVGLAAVLIPTILSLLGTAASVWSQSSSQKKAEGETKKYQNELEKRRSDYENWFKGEYSQNFLDTAEGKSSVNQLGQTLKNTLQNQQTGAIRGGMTTEAQVANQGAAQDVYAQALNKLTGYGTNYKTNLRNSYDYRIQSYLQPLDQLAMGKISNYNQLGGQYGDTASGLTSALAGYDWESLFAGSGGG